MAMTGSAGKSRTALSEINVTPLVDVMLVLLVIFMITTPLMQQGIEVDLPKTKPSGVETNDEPVVLVISHDGKMYIGKTPVKADLLGQKLKAMFEKRKNKQVYLQADRRVNYGVVAEVMADLRSVGIYNIGLITLPKNEL